MPGIVFIRRLYTDFVPGVVFGERVGASLGIVDRLAIAQPLVLHFIGGETVCVCNLRRQG